MGAGQAIGGRRRGSGGEGCGAARAANMAATVGSGGGGRKPMRGTRQVDFMARTGLLRFRGSKSWKEGGRGPEALGRGLCRLGRRPGRDGASFTTSPRAAMTIRRRTANSAGRRPAARRGGGDAKSRKRDVIVKPQHGEKLRNDARKHFAVAFDGQVPVQVNSYPA